MSEPLLTKRLHVSGLTPSITQADLERRLSSFGKVTAMNGFGARDALGDPRKFGFVTMEIGAKELARCLNVLSGSTWKGAKLRIGEAKPDFRERLARFNSQPPRPIRPRRIHSRNHGSPSPTIPLTPLSAAAAASTPGWIVTPSGRVVRPMRMRPERPLEPIRSDLNASKVKSMNGKVKKRIKPPPVRARRRLIDPTKWDSVYLRGVFLNAVPVQLPVSKEVLESPSTGKSTMVGKDEGEETDKGGTDSDVFSTPARPKPQLSRDSARAVPSARRSPAAALQSSSRIHEATEFIDIRDEANAALAMLGQMFGDREDWDGRESVDEIRGVEDDEMRSEDMHVDEEGDIEIVFHHTRERSKSIKQDKGKSKAKSPEGIVCFSNEAEVDTEAARDCDVEMEYSSPVSAEASVQKTEPASRTNLKALFAPKEDVPFSLVDHFDLDLELDTDILGLSAPSGASQENSHMSQPISSIPRVVEIPITKSTTRASSRVMLDPSLPLLFPTSDSLPHPYSPSSGLTTTTNQRATSSCFLFSPSTRVRGPRHLPSSIAFTRSPEDTPKSIRERWENDKASLTHEWKKAWRDARGSRRGRGTRGEIGGGY